MIRICTMLLTVVLLLGTFACLPLSVSADGVHLGDINGDGELGVIDYMMLERAVMHTFTLPNELLAVADIDGNGVINATDYLLLKRVVLNTFNDPNANPPEIISAGDEPAFALDLQSSIGINYVNDKSQLIMTVVLTVQDIRKDARLQEILATLRYDAKQMALINFAGSDNSLDCVTALPYGWYGCWENLTTADDGVIDIALLAAGIPEQYLDAEHPLELTFKFEMAEGCTDATVSIASETVEGVYASGNTVTLYRGEGASATAAYGGIFKPEENDFMHIIIDGEATLTNYTGDGGNVVIPSTLSGVPVTKIGRQAFFDRSDITSVIIPNGVKEIDYYAFGFCTNLTSIDLPSTLTTIGTFAFHDCRSLASIRIPDSVKVIEGGAFYYCVSLTSIHIPKSTTEIEIGAFPGCRLTSLTVDPQNPVYYSDGNCIIERKTAALVQGCSASVIPQGIQTIREYAFYVCGGLTEVTIPSGVEMIEYAAFSECADLKRVVISDSVKIIEDEAFSFCTSLETVILGTGVTSIGDRAFENCERLTSIRIPASVTEMGWDVFRKCVNLTDIFCEAKDEPSGWEKAWHHDCNATVHWGYSAALGDLGGNGKIDSTDYMLLKRAVLGTGKLTEEQKAVADINKDGKINSTDYMLLKRAVLGTYKIA